VLDAGLHPELYRLIKRSTSGERAALIVLVLINMSSGLIGISLLGKGGSFDLVAIACIALANIALLGAILLIPLTRAWRADRLGKAIKLLDRKDLCPNCGQSLDDQTQIGKCPACNLTRIEALSAHLTCTLSLVAPGLRPHMSRSWLRLADEAGYAEAEQVMAELRLPRRPFRISYLLASVVSIGMIVLVFVLMGVSETASRYVAMAAIPVVVVSYLVAFVTSSSAETELVGPLRPDDEAHPAKP